MSPAVVSFLVLCRLAWGPFLLWAPEMAVSSHVPCGGHILSPNVLCSPSEMLTQNNGLIPEHGILGPVLCISAPTKSGAEKSDPEALPPASYPSPFLDKARGPHWHRLPPCRALGLSSQVGWQPWMPFLLFLEKRGRAPSKAELAPLTFQNPSLV